MDLMGLRSAYLNGFQKVMDGSVDAIVQMDADFSHDPSALLDMASLLQVNDVVLGSRYVKGGSVDERWPLWRRSLSAFGNYYARTILGLLSLFFSFAQAQALRDPTQPPVTETSTVPGATSSAAPLVQPGGMAVVVRQGVPTMLRLVTSLSKPNSRSGEQRWKKCSACDCSIWP